MRLTLLGTGHAMTTACYNTCFALTVQGRHLLVDGGGGSGLLAQAKAAGIKAQAEADIAQERKKAINEVKNEIGGIAMDIAGKVVEKEINEADHKKLIEDFIKNVGEAS